MKRLLLLFTALLVVQLASAQQMFRCGTDIMHQKKMSVDTNYAKAIKASNDRYINMMQTNPNALATQVGYGTKYQIPVVVHVIHTGGAVGSVYNPTDSAIISMIDYLNQSYAATYASYPDSSNGGTFFPVEFVLAKRADGCGYSNGINRVNGSSIPNYASNGVNVNNTSGASDASVKAVSRWNNHDYYNVWIVHEIDNNDGIASATAYVAGYAYYPGITPELDGIVILASTVQAGNITLPHEIGHAFNLRHTFEGDGTGSTCPPTTNCATTGDLVCDTEPHRRSPFNCPSGTNPCTGNSYNNVQRNFMDYSSCQDRFTPGQKVRWMDALLNDRAGLVSSIGSVDTGANVASNSCSFSTSNIGNTYNIGPVLVTLNDLSASSNGGYTLDEFKVYQDRTCQQRANLIQGQSYPLTIETETNAQHVQVYIDYNNDGSFSAGELVYDHTSTMSVNQDETHSTTYTVPTTGVTTCTPLRMRVLSDFVSATMPTNGCGNFAVGGQAEDYSVVIKPASANVSATISGTNPSCQGTSVTYTVTPSATLTSPTYQWYLNSVAVGTNSTTYTAPSNVANNSYLVCKINYTGACGDDSVFSNQLTIQRTNALFPSIGLGINPGTTICSGTSVTFTATPANGGTTPSYQWKLNGTNVGSNSATYTNASFSNNDAVSCIMTSSASCVSPAIAYSDTITMTVTPIATPSVSIAANPGTSICSGTSVTFTATPTNGGTPSYQWKLNGTNVGTNSATYTNASLSNSDVVSCVMTSTASCVTSSTATSNNLTMTVTPLVTPTITIGANPGNTICSGVPVTFSAVVTNGGTTPSYQWKLNGSNVGTNSATYTNASLNNNDLITCQLTSNAACASPNPVTSSGITMVTTATLTPSVSIAANTGTTICNGTSVTFTATPTNGGTTPSYQWKVNGTNVGTNSATYTNASLSNSDVVTCVMTSSLACASPATGTSNSLTMTVSPTVTPSVSIAANPGNSICAGTSVTFTATPTNGGTTPSYQWKVNGTNVGTNSATYTNASLSNSDVVTCVMTSNVSCASPSTATSNGITMTVTPTVTPSVSIVANTGSSICAGTSVTFTATPTNGGTTPSYQWKLNGTNVGTNSATYTNATLSNSDVVSCVMTSNATCASPTMATSNGITMSVTATVVPTVSVAANPGNNICAGTSVTFTATPNGGGTTPSYQWKLNGTNVGTNSATYTNASLSNSDVVTCVMTSNAACASPITATSSAVTMTVTPNVTPSVSIVAAPSTTICTGTSVTFTATPTNGGTTPSYQWKVNGTNVGANSATYTSSTLSNNDVVSCVMTSSETCVTSATATSNNITMTVTTTVVPTVTISNVSPNDTICAGTSVTFTAMGTNGGTTPSYQWKVNGTNVGTNSATYTSASLLDADVVTCMYTSSESCAVPSSVTSSGVTMTVNPNLTPSVAISVAPNDTVCAGTAVTFTATPTNGGTTPSYQWKRNGSNVGTNSNMLTIISPNDGDVISCVLTSSETCVTSATATSNNITLEVIPNVTPSVSISVSPNNTICAGNTVTFTAIGTNGGTTPSYQWKVNGTNVGANSATYTTSTLSNADVVSCVMTSSETCVTSATATSNNITMTVNPLLTPLITISVSPNDTICDGATVTFSSNITNGGTNPAYQWLKNNTTIAGETSAIYTTSTLVDGDVITCRLTSSEACVTTAVVTSSGITMEVIPNVTPLVTISVAPKDTICDGSLANFTAVATNGGTSAAYQWKVNGTNVGTNSFFYSNNALSNNDVVSCEMTSSFACVTKQVDTSNYVTMTVQPLTIPTVSMTSSVGSSTCKDGTVTFSSAFTNGGTSRSYQWKLNNVSIPGATNSTFTTTALNNGDRVFVEMTIVADCPAPATVQSDTIVMSVLNPSFTMSVSPDDTICSNTPAMFAITPTDAGNNPQFQWYRNNQLMNGVTSNVFTVLLPSNGDAVTATFTGSDNCVNAPMDLDTIKLGVLQNITPTAIITASPSNNVPNGIFVTFNALTNARNPQYQWRKNGTDISGATGDQYTTNTLETNDSISVLVTTIDSCSTPDSALSNVIRMMVGVSVKEIETRLFDDITLAPNPNNGSFVIKGRLMTSISANEVEVDVINSLGQIVHRGKMEVNNGQFDYHIDLGEKAHDGLHMVRLHLNGRVHYLKFITAK